MATCQSFDSALYLPRDGKTSPSGTTWTNAVNCFQVSGLKRSAGLAVKLLEERHDFLLAVFDNRDFPGCDETPQVHKAIDRGIH